MIKYEQNFLHLPDKIIEFPSEIKEVVPFHDIYLILLKSCAYGKTYTQYSNLCAYNKNGELLWYAELPLNPGGRYYKIITQGEKITAYSEWSYYCIVDPTNGKIVEQIFTK